MSNGIRRNQFRFELLRSGVRYCDAQALAGGEISCTASAALKKSISCTLLLPHDAQLLTDRLRVSLLCDGVWSRLGTFVVTTAPRSVSADGLATYDVEGYDLTYLVYRAKLERRSDGYFAAGTMYTDAVSAILVRCGITDAIIEPSELTLAADREDWEVGESYLNIVNTLLQEIGYTTLWFDANGVARSEPYRSPVLRDVQHRYAAGRDSIILREHTVEDDTFDAYNVFPVAVSNLDTGNPIYVTSVNDDPTSRLSTAVRGRIVAPVAQLDGAADLAAAQAYADNLKLKSMISTETAKIQTAIVPGHEVLDTLEISLPELSGKWEEIGWSIPLSPDGLMTHTIRRAIYV